MQKDIPGFDNYVITDDGKVISKVTNKTLKTYLTRNGYERVSLTQNRITKNFPIHRLVAQAFIEKPEGYDQVNHKDENKRNNNVANLEWSTPKLNSNYGTRNERLMKKSGTKVMCIFPDGSMEIYNSYHEASRKTGFNATRIREATLKGRIYHERQWKIAQ